MTADRITTSAGVYVTAQGAVDDFQGDESTTDVTEHMVRAWARRRRLKTVRIDGRIYYPLAALKTAEQRADENRATLGGHPRPKFLTSP